MTGLFERALGDDWDALHPKLRERYGATAGDGRVAVGTGEMERLSRNALLVPVLWLGTFEDFLFPEAGIDVPFRITTRPFVDDGGHEALFLTRRFRTDPSREIVDTLRWNPGRRCITDLLGRNGRVAADLLLRVDDGDLALELGSQWLRLGDRYLAQPGPLSAEADVRDWYDDEAGTFGVAADIRNPLVGRVFAYRGRFEHDFRPESASTAGSSLGGITLPGADA